MTHLDAEQVKQACDLLKAYRVICDVLAGDCSDFGIFADDSDIIDIPKDAGIALLESEKSRIASEFAKLGILV